MKKRPPIQATCLACNGTGKVPLDPNMSETLKLMSQGTPGRRWTAAELNTAAGGKFWRSAWNNRLERLRKAGLIERVKDGRAMYYFIPPAIDTGPSS